MENASSVENPPSTEPTVTNIEEPQTQQPLDTNVDDEPKEFQYEFSTYHEGRLYFVHLWAPDDRTALEKVTCEPIPLNSNLDKFIRKSDTGNLFFEQQDGTKWCFSKEVYKPSFTLDTDCKPLPQELERRRPTNKQSADDILANL